MFISSSFWKIFSLGIEFWADRLFVFFTLKFSFYCLLDCVALGLKSVVIINFFLYTWFSGVYVFYVECIVSSSSSSSFFFPCYLGYKILSFLNFLIDVFLYFGNILCHYLFKYFFFPVLFFTLWYTNYRCIRSFYIAQWFYSLSFLLYFGVLVWVISIELF